MIATHGCKKGGVMSKDEPKNKKLHCPLDFVLPPSISEFSSMVKSLSDSISSGIHGFHLAFFGMDFDCFSDVMRIEFSLFDRNKRAENGGYYSIDIHITDKGMFVEYPPKCYRTEDVESMIEKFISYVDKEQQKLKAARNEQK